jgi:hypothetical protein
MARVGALAHRVVAGTHQFAHGLIGGVGHAHGGQLARARQPRQHHRVAADGLDAVARAAGNRYRDDHLAGQALRVKVAPGDKAAGAGFVDDMRRTATTDDFAQRTVERDKIAADAAHMSNLSVAAGLGNRDVDAVLVHVQADVQGAVAGGARFTHGQSPRKFATTRPTIGPVHWCSSARPARATYGVAGGGPPEFTKPSCLGVMFTGFRNAQRH